MRWTFIISDVYQMDRYCIIQSVLCDPFIFMLSMKCIIILSGMYEMNILLIRQLQLKTGRVLCYIIWT